MNDKLKEKRGAYSILMVILMLIMVTAFSAYVDITRKTHVVNEVQQKMDVAGLNALNSAVDFDRLEQGSIDEDWDSEPDSDGNEKKGNLLSSKEADDIVKAYKREIFNQIQVNDLVTDVQVMKAEASIDVSSFGTGKGQRERPQVMLESVVGVKIRNTTEFDVMNTNTKEFYSSKNKTHYTITYNGTTEDGEVELLIGSVVRIMYK